MLVASEKGVDFIDYEKIEKYDKIQGIGAFDASMFIENCEFHHYIKMNYRGVKEGTCKNNKIF